MHRRWRWAPLALLLAACSDPSTPATVVDAGPVADAAVDAAPEEDAGRALPPLEQRMQRISLLVRGTRPTLAEYERVSAGGEAEFTAWIDETLQSPEFGETVRAWFMTWLRADVAGEYYPGGFPAVGDLAGMPTGQLNRDVMQAPGRLAEHIVMNGRPWSEIVTADYTVANATVATVWGLPYDYEADGWQVTHYDDGRPNAGVLSDNWYFTRFTSTEGSRNRERAAAVAFTFICHDYPNRPIHIPSNLDLTDPDAIANAITVNPVCVGCHFSLDPLASFFASHYAIRVPEATEAYPLEQYAPEQQADFDPPAYYGTPGEDLADLGRMIAADPRFVRCATRHFASELLQVPLEEVPERALFRYEDAFRDALLDVRALVRHIVRSPEFVHSGLHRLSPRQMSRAVRDLTGYEMIGDIQQDPGGGVIGEIPLIEDIVFGFRTLAGGPDNFDTFFQLRTVNPSTLLVLRALAERAGPYVVSHDAEAPAGERYLLTEAAAFEGDPDVIRAQLVGLHLRLFGQRVEIDDPQIDEAMALYDAVGSGDPAYAWAVTISGLLQDPQFLLF